MKFKVIIIILFFTIFISADLLAQKTITKKYTILDFALVTKIFHKNGIHKQ